MLWILYTVFRHSWVSIGVYRPHTRNAGIGSTNSASWARSAAASDDTHPFPWAPLTTPVLSYTPKRHSLVVTVDAFETMSTMELDLGLRQGFRIGDFEIHPLQQTISSPRGRRQVSELAIAFLIQLAAAPGQVVSGAVLREHLGVADSTDLHRYSLELQQAFGDNPDAPAHIAYIGDDDYELLTPISIDVPPVPTIEQILNIGSERGP